jgi:hypothetical protein
MFKIIFGVMFAGLILIAGLSRAIGQIFLALYKALFGWN